MINPTISPPLSLKYTTARLSSQQLTQPYQKWYHIVKDKKTGEMK